DWQTPVAIAANTLIEGTYAAGNLSLMLNGAGGDPGAASAGGSYGQVNYDTTTRAFIAEGASVQEEAGGDPAAVAVSATTASQVIAIGPTAGRGASFGLNGLFQLVNIVDATSASVDDEAKVKASTLDVTAGESVVSWAMTGAFNMADSAGIGLSVAIN